MKGLFSLVFKGLRYRPVRSWLTVLGVVIGVVVVVAILALGDGVRGAIANTLRMFGSDLILILPGKETNPLLGLVGGQRFREQDLLALREIAGVALVQPMAYATMTVEYSGEKKSVMAHAGNWGDYIKVLEASQGFRLERGRWPKSDEAREVIIGYGVAKNVFGREVRVGDKITVKSKQLTVVGSFGEIGEQMADNVVFISMNLFRELTGAASGASSAFVKLDSEANQDLIVQQITYQLSQQEVVKDFAVLTPDKANRLVGNVLSVVELIMMVIAIVSLAVGAVGIMNTVYTSIVERTKHIGVMKALGASYDMILALFLIESGLIGLVGGMLGIVAGISLAYVAGLIAAYKGIGGLFSWTALDILSFLVVLAFTFTIGVLAGYFPARRAAALEPAEALRYE